MAVVLEKCSAHLCLTYLHIAPPIDVFLFYFSFQFININYFEIWGHDITYKEITYNENRLLFFILKLA